MTTVLATYDLPAETRVNVTPGASYDRVSWATIEDRRVEHRHGPYTVACVALNMETQQELIVLKAPGNSWACVTPAFLATHFERTKGVVT